MQGFMYRHGFSPLSILRMVQDSFTGDYPGIYPFYEISTWLLAFELSSRPFEVLFPNCFFIFASFMVSTSNCPKYL